MTNVHINTSQGSVHVIEHHNGKVEIRLAGLSISNLSYNNFEIHAADAGVAGIIGPHLDFNVGVVLADINKKAKEIACGSTD